MIAAPKTSGPVDSTGRAVLKPLRRKETVLSKIQLTLIFVLIIGFLAISFVFQTLIPDRSEFPLWLMGVSAFLIAPPLVFVAYAFLRDQELDSFKKRELWARVLICSAVYAVTWIAMPLAAFAFNDSYEVGSYVIAGVAMLGIGGTTGMLCFDFDFLMGSVHYGLYMGICLLGRWLAGVGLLPTNLPNANRFPSVVFDLLGEQWLENIAASVAWIVPWF